MSIGLGLILSGCDLREGTIVYDVDFPNADSCDASGNCDDGSGSGSGGAGSDGGSDNTSVGFTLSKTTATVSETGSTDTFTVVLDSLPSADVVFGVSDDDNNNSELSLSAASSTFGTGNWSTAQTITLTGLDDSDVDGNVSSTVTVAVSFSADTNYAGLSAQTVSVTTIDNDSAGFTLSQTTATVSENGSTDSFSIVLNNSPTADVSFSLSDNDSDDSELSLSATSLTFGTGNWSTAQTITLTGLDDNDLDADVVSTVTVSVSSSADTNYAGLTAQTVSVTTQDDELASVTWDAVTSGEQQIELTWLAYSGASSYTIYWNTSGSVDNNSSSFSEISGTASTSCPGGAASCLSYNHGGLNSSAYYYYRIVANVSGKLTELSTEENASPLALSCTPSYTHDNDSDLLVYYDFNNNLEDQIDNYSDGRYDLTNTGGTIRFPAGCSDGLAGYFDSTSGYAYN
ncbi:MAG: hypothetical protein EBR97_03005, partial [Firmicutes bacterium]|nr:hypothetical protein [Bacillota bacterium]